MSRYRVTAVAVPVAFGVAKVVAGLGRGRPVSILLALLAATVLLGMGVIAHSPFCSRAGAAVLSRVRHGRARAARAPSPDELPLAFALTGSVVLIGRDYRSFLVSARPDTP